MSEVDFMSVLHKSTKRDYLGRVNDPMYPKEKAAQYFKENNGDMSDYDAQVDFGFDDDSIFTWAEASSIKSIALSGRHLSLIYLWAKRFAVINASSVIVTP